MLKLLDHAIEIAIGLVAATLLVTTFGQVVARYLFDRPFTWVIELGVVLLTWLTMLAGYVGVRRNMHIAIDFIVGRLPPGLRRAVSFAGLVVSAGFVAVLGWTSFPVIEAMEGMTFVALEMDRSWLYWSVPVGAALMLVAFVIEFHNRLRRPGA